MSGVAEPADADADAINAAVDRLMLSLPSYRRHLVDVSVVFVFPGRWNCKITVMQANRSPRPTYRTEFVATTAPTAVEGAVKKALHDMGRA